MSEAQRGHAGPLAVWANAWMAGRVSIDEAVDAVTGTDAMHQVVGLPGDRAVAGLRDVLLHWRRAQTGVRVVLPAAGDVRGLPGPASFRAAALEAGEVAVGGSVDRSGGLGLVPSVQRFDASSAPTSVVWQAYVTDAPPPDHLAVVDAQYELATAIRETATALAAADVAGRADQRALRDARRAGEELELPRGFPQRAIALLAQAERVQAVLDLALADPMGGAVGRFGMSAREAALRPLVIAVRRAMVAGYNAEAPG